MEGKAEMVKANCWSEKAIDEFEKISNSESLIFHYSCHFAKQHLFGSIEVKTYTGISVKMNEVLKKLDEAIDAKDFEKGKSKSLYLEIKYLAVYRRYL